jgi:hypothetical protein
MSAFAVALGTVGAIGAVSATFTLASAARLLQRRARKRAGASARVSNIRVTYEDGHSQVVRPTAETVRAVKVAIRNETNAESRRRPTSPRTAGRH